jgi:hypothetical protein
MYIIHAYHAIICNNNLMIKFTFSKNNKNRQDKLEIGYYLDFKILITIYYFNKNISKSIVRKTITF